MHGWKGKRRWRDGKGRKLRSHRAGIVSEDSLGPDSSNVEVFPCYVESGKRTDRLAISG
jgi:hypothetical protein